MVLALDTSAFMKWKWPASRTVKSDFIKSNLENNKKHLEEDLARSGLTANDIAAKTNGWMDRPTNCTATYAIPYTSPDGKVIVDSGNEIVMWRTRQKYPEWNRDGKRYNAPNGKQLKTHGLPASPPYIPPFYHLMPHTDTLYICEGEKKTMCVSKYIEQQAIGIGGCQNWRQESGSNEVHEWIINICKRHEKIVVIPDGDVFRYDICAAYGNFVTALKRQLGGEIPVEILSPDDKIDDLIVSWGPEAEGNFADLELIDVEQLIVSPSALASEYGLAFKQVKGGIQLHQHSSNITKILENHPSFETIWRDTDKGRIMIGEQVAVPDSIEMEIANHLQHHFQLTGANHKLIRDVIKALAEKNNRSPMLEWVEDQHWDGKPRLDTWMSSLWGVEDSPYTRQVASRWFIGAVARMSNPGCKLDWMLVTVGGQGVGKSSMPELAFRGNSVNLYGSHNDKDIHMKLHSGLCMVLDELDSFTKGEVTFWKSLITSPEDRFRPPYGSAVRTFPRRSLIYGTSNTQDFLAEDKSGYRRYMPVQVTRKLDFEKFKEIMPQLWAEAEIRYKAGEVYYEVTEVDKHKEDYVVQNPMKDKVQQFLHEWCVPSSKHMCEVRGKKHWEFKLTDFSMWANEEGRLNSPVWAREVSGHLRSFGAEKTANLKTQVGRGWRICKEDKAF